MNRRGFFRSLVAVPAAAYVVPNILATSAPVADYAMNTTGSENWPRIERADGRRFIVGVATETVHAGDFVQIQTRGAVNVRVQPMK